MNKVVPHRGQQGQELWLLNMELWMMFSCQKEGEGVLLMWLLDMQHWTVKQHGTGFKDGAGAK